MDVNLGAAGILAVATLTPGPNNFAVLAAARRGFAAVWPSIAGIVVGSLALLAVVIAGAGAVFEAVPGMRTACAIVSCAYLALLGARMLASVVSPARTAAESDVAGLPSGAVSLFAFQFVNPKGWALVLAVTATAPAQQGALARFVGLAPLFAVIPTASLLLWAAFGAASAKLLARRPWALRVQNVLLGLLLVVSAAALLAPLRGTR